MPPSSTLGSVLQTEATWRFVDRISEKTIIDAAEDVSDLLRICGLMGVTGELRTNHAPIGIAKALPLQSKTSTSITFEVYSDVLGLTQGDRLIWTFDLFREHYVLISNLSDHTGQFLTTDSSTRSYRIHQRQLDRSPIDPKNPIQVKVREVTGKRRILGVVTDLSPRGLGLELSVTKKEDLARILAFDQDIIVEVSIPGISGGAPVPAKIAHWRIEGKEANRIQIGVACAIPLAMGDEHSLEDFLMERKYPNVHRARSDFDFQEIWRLMRLAYQSINTVPDDTRKDSSIITWKKASWSHRPINRLYVLSKPPENGGNPEVLGTFASSRYYSKTWLLHQLAVDGTKGQLLSHQLYGRVVDYLRQTDEVKYVMGTFPSDARVFQKYYVDFIRNDPHQEFHYLEENNIYEFDVAAAMHDVSGVARNPNLIIEPISFKNQSYVMAELRKIYPAMVLEAMDLTEFDSELRDVSVLYDRVSLRRKREIYVARVNNEPVGFAIAEWGSEDQNVFSLFDNFRVFCRLEGSEALDVKKALMERMFKSYEREKVRTVITWSKDASLLSVAPSGKEFHGAYFWIAAANRMKPFLRHLDRLHGQIDAIRMRRKKSNNPQDIS